VCFVIYMFIMTCDVSRECVGYMKLLYVCRYEKLLYDIYFIILYHKATKKRAYID
jgi:hypothetical protein